MPAISRYCLSCGFGTPYVNGMKPHRCQKCGHDYSANLESLGTQEYPSYPSHVPAPTPQPRHRPIKPVRQPVYFEESYEEEIEEGIIHPDLLDLDGFEVEKITVEDGSRGSSLGELIDSPAAAPKTEKGKKITKKSAKDQLTQLKAFITKTYR